MLYLVLFAILTVMTNAQSYEDGDTIIVSGKVNDYSEKLPVGLIVSYGNLPLHFDQIIPASNGDFSTNIKATGPNWGGEGTYNVKVTYDGNHAETSFYFSIPKSDDIIKDTDTDPNDSERTIDKEATTPPIKDPVIPKEKNDDDNTKSTSNTVNEKTSTPTKTSTDELVQKEIDEFRKAIDISKDPTYYLDRYNSEASYKNWFDEYFPNITIRQALEAIFPDSLNENDGTKSERIPPWVKNIFQWYAYGEIDEDSLINALEYLISSGIINVTS